MSNAWIEKYRPKSIKDVILPKRLKLDFAKCIQNKDINNIILYSHRPGTGKTTTAKAMAKHLAGNDYIYINASLDNGVDVLRERIVKFASTASMSSIDDSIKKVVILDEFDGSSVQLQKALRASAEEFDETCRFIVTCNYIDQLSEPLHSRFEMVNYNFSGDEVKNEIKPQIVNRLKAILGNEKIEYNEEVLVELVDRRYPDIRSMVKILGQYSRTSSYIDNGIFNVSTLDDEFFDLLFNKKITDLRKYLAGQDYNYSGLYRELYDKLLPRISNASTLAAAMSYIREGLRDDASSSDKEITFAGCCVDLMTIIK